MTNRKALLASAREWLAGLTALSIIVAPMAGCPGGADLCGNGNGGKDDQLTNKSSGFFINDDNASNLLVAGRNDNGDGFFIYGSRNSQGRIGEIESIVLRTQDGK